MLILPILASVKIWSLLAWISPSRRPIILLVSFYLPNNFYFSCYSVLLAACECACKIVLLAVFGRYLSVALPLVLGSVFLIQRFYLRTSRQVRLLDIEAKAPVYLLFLETASGASTIRAFGWEHLFKRVLEARLDWSQRPVYVLYCIQQWLTLVLDLIVAMLAVILVIIIVTWRDVFGPGAVGVSLVTVMTFSNALTRLVTYWAALETSVGAVGRIKTFVENTPTEEEELQIPHPISPPTNWPTAGAINHSNVVATYKCVPISSLTAGQTLCVNANLFKTGRCSCSQEHNPFYPGRRESGHMRRLRERQNLIHTESAPHDQLQRGY